jgi:transglutaminase-like putative cysteine protease
MNAPAQASRLFAWWPVPRSSTRARTDAMLMPRELAWLGALIVAAQLPHLPSLPVWVSITGILLVALRALMLYRDRRHPGMPPSRMPQLLLAAGALALAFAVKATYGYLLGREPCVAFLYLLVATKYLEARDRRDGTLLVCLSGFLVITPFFHSQSMLAALAGMPALLLTGATLDVLTRTARPAPIDEWRAPLRRAGRLLVQGIPIAGVLFLLFPRLSAPLWGLPTDHAAKTGLSDRMSPYSISELSLSDAIAFRVDFESRIPPPAQRYWRGPVLSRFDGREWTMQVQRLDGALVRTGGAWLGYTVTLEPHFKPWLFALDLPSTLPTAEVEPGSGADANIAFVTRTQQLLARNVVTQPLTYQVRSILRDRYPGDDGLDGADNLRLPHATNDPNPKTVEFARKLRDEHPDAEDFIRAVLRWFRTEQFVYTLGPTPLERNPIDGFLFETRNGFCEHYASAFVVLLRAAGIPSRVVTGYQGGEINPRGGYMIVRQSDAHAWAEALINGEWRRFDPTAAVSPSRIETGLGGALPLSDKVPIFARIEIGWLKAVQLEWDAINHGWRRNVIGFNHDHQRSLWRDWKIDRLHTWQYVALIAAFAFAWIAILLGALMWQRRRHDRARGQWQRLCARLARAGLPRLPHEGPLAYTERAAARWPRFGGSLRTIGEDYASLRYGPIAERPDNDRQRIAALERFARAVAALPGSAELRARGGD